MVEGKMTHFDNHAEVSNQAGYQYIYGNAYFGTQPAPPTSTTTPNYNLGIRLGRAPQIDEDDLIGRQREIEQLQSWLAPQSGRQRVVALTGMGGIGKTQLSIHMIKQSGSRYSSVFWLSAKDENSLRAELAALAIEVGEARTSSNLMDTQEEEQLVQQARQWLSHPDNEKWLLVLDNYDDPRLPGMDSLTGYDIRKFFPVRAQGSILITTRSRQLRFAIQLALTKLELQQSVEILVTASGRKGDGDSSAERLAQRLDGLPLALATAGAYMRQSADTFDDYLELYSNSWNELNQDSQGPIDYEDRTLYSTWNVSFEQVQQQDAAAAELLKTMAYLDNQDLWYELFQAGLSNSPTWLEELSKSRVRFNRAISKLADYSLIEVSEGRYSLHTCVHDWTLEYLNREINQEKYAIAIHCVAENVKWESEAEYWIRNRRVLPHAQRLQLRQLKTALDWTEIDLDNLECLAEVYRQNDMNMEAEEMYNHALQGYEKVQGVEDSFPLRIVNNLGTLYRSQGRMAEAEEMYMRALQGYEKVQGVEDSSTLTIVNNLGTLYQSQGRMAEAKDMCMRALRGREKTLGAGHISTLNTINSLGVLYAGQGKKVEAEEMYMRALRGKEKALGAGHRSTLNTVNNLGVLYVGQGKTVEAEEMYTRALRGYETALGIEHTSTLDTVYNLGLLYAADQGRVAEAKEMYIRALRGYKKAFGTDHPKTKIVTRNLRDLDVYKQRKET